MESFQSLSRSIEADSSCGIPVGYVISGAVSLHVSVLRMVGVGGMVCYVNDIVMRHPSTRMEVIEDVISDDGWLIPVLLVRLTGVNGLRMVYPIISSIVMDSVSMAIVDSHHVSLPSSVDIDGVRDCVSGYSMGS